MGDPWQNSVVLITSRVDSKSAYGTGFVVHRDERGTYVLTCTHVVDDVGGKELVKVNDIPAMVIASSPANNADIAVLHVEGLADKSLLRPYVSARRNGTFKLAGYYHLDDNPKKKLVFRLLRGIFSDEIQTGMTWNTLVPVWEIEITSNEELRPGNSGSPVVDENNHVVGIVNTRLNSNKKRGWVTPIETLKQVWPEMPPDLFIQNTVGSSDALQTLPKDGGAATSTLWHSLEEVVFDGANTRNRISPLKKGLFVSIVFLLVLAVIFFSIQFNLFHSSQPPTSQQPSQNSEKVSDAYLSAMMLRVDSSSFVFSGNPGRYSGGGDLPTEIGAVLLAKKTTSSYTIVLSVQNIQHTGNDMVIDYVTLQLLQIPPTPRPLTVWTRGVTTSDTTHPYPTTYAGQHPGQSLHALPTQNVSLAPDEPDQLDIEVYSTVSAFLQFKVAIIYHITGSLQTLTLPWTFQVIFSDASNWQEYILQGGSLVRKS